MPGTQWALSESPRSLQRAGVGSPAGHWLEACRPPQDIVQPLLSASEYRKMVLIYVLEL